MCITRCAQPGDVFRAMPLDPTNIAVRPVSDVDRDFLRMVFISTRAAEFAGSALAPAQVDTLLAEQFAIQDINYRRHYPDAHFDVVVCNMTCAPQFVDEAFPVNTIKRPEVAGIPLGRLYHDWSSGELRVIDIALALPYRGMGIGTRLMHALLAEAARRKCAASLYVEMNNPVRALYRRLGFVKVGENGVYEMMRREAGPFDVVASGADGKIDLLLDFQRAPIRSTHN